MHAWAYIIIGGLLILLGGVLAGYGWHIMPNKSENNSTVSMKEPKAFIAENIVNSKEQQGGITANQITINNYFQQDLSRKEIQENELKNKYPLGYAVFAADSTDIHVPKGFNYGTEFLINWETAKVINLAESSVTINLPDMVYKPLNSTLLSITMEIPRKNNYERRLPFKFEDQNIIPFIELLEDHKEFVVLVLGFK